MIIKVQSIIKYLWYISPTKKFINIYEIYYQQKDWGLAKRLESWQSSTTAREQPALRQSRFVILFIIAFYVILSLSLNSISYSLYHCLLYHLLFIIAFYVIYLYPWILRFDNYFLLTTNYTKSSMQYWNTEVSITTTAKQKRLHKFSHLPPKWPNLTWNHEYGAIVFKSPIMFCLL